MRQLVASVGREKESYEKVIISNRFDQPYIFFLFYEKYPPQKYLAEGGTISGSVFANLNRFDKYEFRKIDPQQLSTGKLYVWPTAESINCLKVQETTFQSDGKPLANIGVVDLEKEGCRKQ